MTKETVKELKELTDKYNEKLLEGRDLFSQLTHNSSNVMNIDASVVHNKLVRVQKETTRLENKIIKLRGGIIKK